MKTDAITKLGIVLLIIAIILLALMYYTGPNLSGLDAVIVRNNEAIDSLQRNMREREDYRDSLLKERLDYLKELEQLRNEQTHITYEYQKDTSRIGALPANGIYRQLANDIAARYDSD